MAEDVLTDVERHCFSETRHEVGGVLYGTLDEAGVTVAGALPALKATADQTSVTFTHEVWEGVHAALDADHPGQRIVGWYHTHPGFGLFLSEYDKFIHENFFSDARMVALVVDPLAGELAWFEWRDHEIVTARTAATATAATGPRFTAPVTRAATTRSSVRRSAPALLSAGLVLAAGGYFLGSRTPAETPPEPAAAESRDRTGELDEAQQRVERLEDKTAELRAALAHARDLAGSAQKTHITYVVQYGDTLSAIARFLYGDANGYRRIVAATPGLDPDHLEVGQRLTLPLPRTSGE
jgi:proteasome lid subunit RPN8/RPN11